MTTTDPKLIEQIAQALWFDHVDQHGYPNGLPTWDEMIASEKHCKHTVEQFRSYADAILPILAAAINEAVQNERAGQWQDIATAPRDGSVILAYRPDAGVFTAHYVEEDAHLSNAMNPPEGDCYWFTTGGEDLTDDMPTHWMPLPSPPAIEAHKESQP